MRNITSFKLNQKMQNTALQTHLYGKGFSTVEILVVVCIIGVLLFTAIKQYQIYKSQARIAEVLAGVQGVRLDVEEYYMSYGRWPQSSSELRDPTMNINDPNYSKHRITLQNGGAINIWFQNMHDFRINDPVLTIRPVLAGEDGHGIISWISGNAAAPVNAIVWGENQSNIPERFLIKACR